MKFSENTLAVLKNISIINASDKGKGGVVLKPGNELTTIAPSRYIHLRALIQETLETEFAIYDLSLFLSNVSQLGGANAEFEFSSNKVVIRDPSTGISMNYFGCEPGLILSPSKNMPEIEWDVTFPLQNSMLARITKLSGLNGFDRLSVIGEDDNMFIKGFRHGGSEKNMVRMELGENTTGKNFEAVFTIDHLKILPLDYVVDVNFNGISRWTSSDDNIVYHISLSQQESN